jgi:hypothetical protein
VKRFETKVAPTNYQRPTALVTPRMVEDAKNKLIELGLYDAIPRRYAALSDVSINDVVYADRGVQPRLKNADVFDTLKTQVGGDASPKAFDRVDAVSIETFLSEVLPLADTIEVFVENKHEKNLVSLVTAKSPDAAHLFKWDNPFSWSYNGDLADSHIRERVAAKGGNVTGEVCCRLAWNNYDDLDLHMTEKPAKCAGFKISYKTRGRFSPSKGQLDVDAMAGGGRAGMPRDPVENIYYGSIKEMHEGEYLLQVHQYKLVEKADTGFTVEIDIQGKFTASRAGPTLRTGSSLTSPRSRQRREGNRYARDAVVFAVPEALGTRHAAVAACVRDHDVAEPLGRREGCGEPALLLHAAKLRQRRQRSRVLQRVPARRTDAAPQGAGDCRVQEPDGGDRWISCPVWASARAAGRKWSFASRDEPSAR